MWSQFTCPFRTTERKWGRKVNDPNNKIQNWLYNHRYKSLRLINLISLKDHCHLKLIRAAGLPRICQESKQRVALRRILILLLWQSDQVLGGEVYFLVLNGWILVPACRSGFSMTSFYSGKTKKPEKVEYFHPPMRFPRSSLRCTLSSLSIRSKTPLLAASLVTSWSPANAEITG